MPATHYSIGSIIWLAATPLNSSAKKRSVIWIISTAANSTTWPLCHVDDDAVDQKESEP
jgi:hypothetical protein